MRVCYPKVNPLTAGRIDDKAERAVLAEEYSQLDFVKYIVKNSASHVTSTLSGPSPCASRAKTESFPSL